MNDPNRTPPVDDNLDSTGPPIRVLVVDDDEPHAQAVAESLGKNIR